MDFSPWHCTESTGCVYSTYRIKLDVNYINNDGFELRFCYLNFAMVENI